MVVYLVYGKHTKYDGHTVDGFRNPARSNHRLDGPDRPAVNNGIHYQPQLVSRISDINSSLKMMPQKEKDIVQGDSPSSYQPVYKQIGGSSMFDIFFPVEGSRFFFLHDAPASICK